jgi:hypothetical protein
VNPELERRIQLLYWLVEVKGLGEESADHIAVKMLHGTMSAEKIPNPALSESVEFVKHLIVTGLMTSDLGSHMINHLVELETTGMTNVHHEGRNDIPRGVVPGEVKDYLFKHGTGSATQIADYIAKKYSADYSNSLTRVYSFLWAQKKAGKICYNPGTKKYWYGEGSGVKFPACEITGNGGNLKAELV